MHACMMLVNVYTISRVFSSDDCMPISMQALMASRHFRLPPIDTLDTDQHLYLARSGSRAGCIFSADVTSLSLVL